MNLASRCREAIAQAASLKKELIAQKRKTAEAVSQTHQLLSELKKMKNSSPERKSRRQQQEGETPSIVTEATAVASSIADDASKSPESISTKSTIAALPCTVEDISDEDEPKHHDPSTPNGLVSSDDYEPPGQPSPPRPDAPASFEDESEEQDTVADTIPDKPPSFPINVSPQIVRRFPGVNDSGSYDEEYPTDLSCQSTKTTNQSLLSSIDAFEASFKTSFPKSFTPKEGDEQNVAYDPFDTNSPQKRMIDHKGVSDPPGDHTAPHSPSRIDRSPRDTVPKEGGRKVPSLDGDRHVKSMDDSAEKDSPTQIAGERLADRFQKSLDAANKRILKSEEAVSPQNRTTTESMVSRLKKNLTSQGSPPDENFVLSKTIRSSGGSSKLVSSPPLAEDQHDPFHLAPLSPTLAPLDHERSQRNAVEEPIDPLDKYQVALRKDVTKDARQFSQQRSVSAPRGFSPDQQNFATARAQYERTASRRQNDGEIPMQSSIPAKAKVTRSWQRPKALLLAGDDDDDDDDNGKFRQRRNVNLSKVAARRADFGGGASPIVVSPKTLGR